ncbi:hypothetical protein [Pseudomonas viridiflava]|uniref:hypothetical protein n=1 Tax=Pseudomonas viridiflava TaxID=33069 RepID=UPI0019813DA5|nr:hypothetical protein [Pseudomonas viridiflava]
MVFALSGETTLQGVSPRRDLLIATDHLTILNASLFRDLRQPASGRRYNQAFLVRFGIELALLIAPDYAVGARALYFCRLEAPKSQFHG